MRSRRAAIVLALSCASLSLLGGCPRCSQVSPPAMIDARSVRLDARGKLLAWPDHDAPYAVVVRLAWDALMHRVPTQSNGLPTYMGYSRFAGDSFDGIAWPHNPAGLTAMLIDSASLWFAFSGDREVVSFVQRIADHQLAHGTTPASALWAGVPFASANAGDTEYGGADDEWCGSCGRGDGVGVIEPDKVGELGFGYAQLYEMTGDARYLAAAVACADALARHVRSGDAKSSPWPFRVNAQSGEVREEYCANALGPILLFDELARLGVGDEYRRARETAWRWLVAYPMHTSAWSAYFEDIPIYENPDENPNQYTPMQTAKFMLDHAHDAAHDPYWKDHSRHLMTWVRENFADDANNERGVQFGADVLSEQRADMAKMGSHTARYAAVHALYFEKTGELWAKEKALRSFNWATYMCSPSGVVTVGEDKNEGWWFSDGYGDYMRHFLVGMAAVPEWAPSGENHLLRSSSVVRSIGYEPASVSYVTFHPAATEVLRLRAAPLAVTAGDAVLELRADLDGERPNDQSEGYTITRLAEGVVVHVRHVRSGEISITLAP
jgi:hypothetical protein